MMNLHASTRILGLALGLAAASVGACGDGETPDTIHGRPGPDPSTADGGLGTNGKMAEEERLFREIEAETEKRCGGACHTQATHPKSPPFLAPPDAYKSVKAYPGIITKDVYQSAFLTKGPHDGPAVSIDPEFEKKVVKWLEMESLAIRLQKLPTTPPTPVVQGANDIDLSPIAAGGLSGVRIKFEASLVGTMLKLSNIKIVAPAGQDVHVLQPKFFRVLGQPKGDTTDVEDPADSFSNADQTVPGGQETTLNPGTVLFSGESWRPFNVAADKIRIEATKLEPGKITVLEPPKTCKNVQLFATNILPFMRGGGGFTPNCSGGNCHASGLAGLALAGQDDAATCNQVLAKLNQGNIAQSLIITKVTQGPHNGGTVNNPAAWSGLFTQNAAAFF